MKRVSAGTYTVIKWIVGLAMRLMHPRFKINGRERVPDGPAVYCCNHSSLSDPIWVLLALDQRLPPRIMAKKELLDMPFLGWLYRKMGAFPVDRGNRDIAAIRTAMTALREGDPLLIFPEGTRIRNGKTSEPHNGALMIAAREEVPVVPIYLTAHKRFWHRIDVVFGEPFTIPSARPTQDELTEQTRNMMKTIYAMGEKL